MPSKKITGWILLAAGLAIMFWVFYSSYNIFTAKTEVPELFKVSEKEELSSAQKERAQDLQTQIEGAMGEMIGEQLKGLLPADFLPKLLNLSAWSIFAGISIFTGTQISGLGIRLIKIE